MQSLSKLRIYAKSKNRVKEEFVPDLSLYFYYFKRRPFFIIDLNRAAIMFKNEKVNLPFYINRKCAPFLFPMNHLLKKDWVEFRINTGNPVISNLPSLKHIWDYCYANIVEEVLTKKGGQL